MAGIEVLQSVLDDVTGIVVQGIRVAKKWPKLMEEAKDIDIGEGGALLVQIVTKEAPAIIAALKE